MLIISDMTDPLMNITPGVDAAYEDQYGYGNYDYAAAGNGSHHNNYQYYYYAEYDTYEYTDHIYHIFDFEVPVYGYIWPILVLITACCNILVIVGFLRQRMRNATNILLVSIAISDSLTGLVTLPATIHVFSESRFALTKGWCEATMLSRLFVSRAFHTASVWQTLLLAVYRYFQLRDPVKAQQWITMPRSLILIAISYILAFILHVYHLTDIKTHSGMCHWIVEEPCVRTCIYIWCALLFGHVLPSVLLVGLTIGMVRRLRRFDESGRGEMEALGLKSRKKTEQFRMLTKTVIAIVVIFLVPELPYGLFYLVTVSLGHSNQAILPLNVNRLVHCIYEILMVLSFHLNFWVYCLLIRNFRSCIKRFIQLITCRVVTFKRLDDSTTTSSNGVELQAMTSAITDITEGQSTSDKLLKPGDARSA